MEYISKFNAYKHTFAIPLCIELDKSFPFSLFFLHHSEEMEILLLLLYYFHLQACFYGLVILLEYFNMN